MSAFEDLYPVLAGLLSQGVALDVNADGGAMKIAALHDERNMICQFSCDEMTVGEVFAHLESLAARHENEGIATDEINGREDSTW